VVTAVPNLGAGGLGKRVHPAGGHVGPAVAVRVGVWPAAGSGTFVEAGAGVVSDTLTSMVGTAGLVRRIIDRRRAHDDDDRHLLGDDERDALAAVRYVRTHRRVSRPVLQDDVEDALAITERLRAEVDAEQEALLRMARAGTPALLTWQRIAAAMGMSSRQGPRDRLRRIGAARAGMTDAEARGDTAVRRRRARWLAAGGRAERVREVAAAWGPMRDRVPEAWAEDVDDLVDLVDVEASAIAVRDLARQLDAAGVEDGEVSALIGRTRTVLDGFPSRR
jgi:hypothetical protein